ncbi:MAG: AsmA family protein [Nitrospirales bacterium]|nr:AsmA family protein [Nitrospirales bacterium]
MRRRSYKIVIGLVLGIGACAALVYVLFPFIKTELYRETLERGFSATLGRTVLLEGPIALTFSLHPRLILENVSVSNPPWTAHPHLFRVDRLEIGLSLGPLLQRRLEAEKIALEGAELILEEGAKGLDNWTFREKDRRPGIMSRAMPSVFMTFAERGEINIESSRIMYRPYPAEEMTEVLIQRGLVIALNDQTRKFTFEGIYHDSPVNIQLIGGRIMDLFSLTEAWPVDGVLSTKDASASFKGTVGNVNSDGTFDLHVQVHGNRLSALNGLLETDLPDSAPFTIAADYLQGHDVITLNNVRGTLGTSDLAGQLSIQNGKGRQEIRGKLSANIFQIHDFLFSPKSTQQGKEAKQGAATTESSTITLPADMDLDLTIEKCLFEEIELGSVSLTASVREGQVDLSPVQVKAFGGTADARVTVELRTPQPHSVFAAKGTSLNYGHVLRALGVTENIAGSTDFEVTASGSGASLQELLKTVTMNLQTAHTTFGLSTSIPEDPLPVSLHQASLQISNGGPVKVGAQGAYRERAFGVKLMTAPPIGLTRIGTSWPVSLTALSGGALLEVKGTLDTGRRDMPGNLIVSLKGRRLSDFDPDLPPVGPYALMAHVRKEGDRFKVDQLRSRFGNSDLSGRLEINLQKSRPHLTGTLTSQQINVAEFSGPSDRNESAIPSEAMRAFDGDVNVTIDRVRSGGPDLADLVFTAGLQDGRLKVESVHGTIQHQRSAYGNFHGRFQVDTTGPVPTLAGNGTFEGIRYDRLFPSMPFAKPTENDMTLDVRFSSLGNTIPNMLNRSTVQVEGENLSVRFHLKGDHLEPVQVSSNLKIESVDGGPLQLYAEGVFDKTPFRLRSATGPMRNMLKDEGLWPVNIRMDVPKALVEMSGHVHLSRPGDEFDFQVLLKGQNLSDLNVLTMSDLPVVGPVDINLHLSRTPVGFHLTNIEGSLGENSWGGNLTVLTKEDRTRVRGKLIAESFALDTFKEPQSDSLRQNKQSRLGPIAGSVRDIGSVAFDTVRDTIGLRKEPKISTFKAIPDFPFPVETLRSFDLMLDGEIKQIRKGEEDLGHAAFQVTLEEGVFTMQSVTGNLWEGDFDGKLILDGKQYVPTLKVNLNIHGLDYGRVARSFGGTDLVKGQSQSITLDLKGRGDTMHEVLEQASGQFNLIDGPLDLATKYIDLWAADLITTALTTAWKSESVSKLNCTVGYFDIEEGVMKSDNILIDTNRLTVAGVGKLNLADETMDLLLTPRPKDPSLFSLAHMVRITGPLSDPDVSSDKLRIAESGGWGLLGLVNPLGWVIAIPQIAGTTVGTMNQNPCVAAMKSRQHTAQALDEIKGGLWGSIKRAFSNLGGSSKDPPDKP